MSPETVLWLGQRALEVTSLLAAPLLLSALVIGLIVGLFQAATQINEMTLGFVPKLVVLVLALILAGPWMLRILMDFTLGLFGEIPSLVG
jgi:flagellar biosynthetic protein FliQ